MKRIFVTGISTDVGKTLAAAIITQALEADYWKPVQAGNLDYSDSHTVRDLVANSKTFIHPNAYALSTPMSPHGAAPIDGVEIDLKTIKEPTTENHLVIEGAGGLLVPLNDTHTVFDIMAPHYKVVVVSRHYLGSINHTLLTMGWLQRYGYQPYLLFSGDEHRTTEEIILKRTGAPLIGRIHEEKTIDQAVIQKYAERFRKSVEAL